MESNAFTEAMKIVDLGRIYDYPTVGTKKGGRILDWLSAMIKGFVDIAKDPYIVRLNVNAWTYNMVSFLLRTGKGKWAFYFVGQPILKEMAEEVLKTKGKYGVDRTKSPSQLEKEAIESVLDKYDPTGSYRKEFQYINSNPELKANAYRNLFETFFDEDGNDVGEGAAALAKIEVIRTENKNPLLSSAKFQIACDVKNPLCGKQGATYIFGPQKGVTEEQKSKVDEAMKHYADVTKESLGCDFADCEGAGAAGGLGYAFLSYLAGELIPGVELILQATGLEEKMKNADVVVTGEGRLDAQTVMGKAPVGVAALAKKYNAKVIAFAGSVAPEASVCNQAGIDAFFPIVRGVTTLEEAMKKENAMENIAATAEQVFRLL